VLYIDTSSLLKLLWEEPESEWTRQRIAAEQKVILSSLAELETDVQLAGARLAGRYSRAKLNAYRRALLAFPQIDPFDRADLSSQLFHLVHRLAYNGDVVAFKMGRRQGARRAHI
jgi:uncharacterized protein with PIN domain